MNFDNDVGNTQLALRR